MSSARRKQERLECLYADRKFGNTEEELNLPIISKFLNLELKKTNKYFVFDFESDTVYVELKSRRNAKAQYPTTIVGKNKLDYAETCGKDVFFFFKFTDGLYYWKYDKSMIGDKIKIARGGRRDRFRIEMKEYGYIPVELLLPIPQ
jgi:hypothetical protein